MENLIKKKENKVVKAFGLSVEAVKKINDLAREYEIPKSQLIENLILNIDDYIGAYDHELQFSLSPVSKQGAKFGRGGAYKDPKVGAYEYALGAACRKAWQAKPLTGPLRGEAVFIIKAPKTTTVGYARKDLDNMAKALLDGVKGIVMEDDSQLVALNLKKVYGDADEVVLRLGRASICERWVKAGKKWKWV